MARLSSRFPNVVIAIGHGQRLTARASARWAFEREAAEPTIVNLGQGGETFSQLLLRQAVLDPKLSVQLLSRRQLTQVPVAVLQKGRIGSSVQSLLVRHWTHRLWEQSGLVPEHRVQLGPQWLGSLRVSTQEPSSHMVRPLVHAQSPQVHKAVHV